MGLSFNEDYTGEITAETTIEAGDYVTGFTLLVVTGTCTVTGSKQFKGNNATPITLSAGQSYTRQASLKSFLKGYTITPSGGTTNLTVQF